MGLPLGTQDFHGGIASYNTTALINGEWLIHFSSQKRPVAGSGRRRRLSTGRQRAQICDTLLRSHLVHWLHSTGARYWLPRGESSFFCQDRGSVLLYAEVLDPALQYWPNLRQCILKKVTLAYSATNGCSFEAILFRGDGHFWPTSAITYIIQHIRKDSPRYRKANIQVPTPPGHTHTWAVLGVYSIRVLSGKLVVAKGIFWNDEIETPYIILEISFPKAVIIRMNNPHSITPIYILCLRPLRDAKEN